MVQERLRVIESEFVIDHKVGTARKHGAPEISETRRAKNNVAPQKSKTLRSEPRFSRFLIVAEIKLL